MFGLGPPELVLILLLVLIVFGAGKLPQVFGSLGKGVKEFREASESTDNPPTTTTTTTASTTNVNPTIASTYAPPTAPYVTPPGTTPPASITTETIETRTQDQ